MDKFLTRNWIGRIVVSSMILLLAACQPAAALTVDEKHISTMPPTTQAQNLRTSTPTATTTAVFVPGQNEDSDIPPTPILQRLPSTLRFVFPAWTSSGFGLEITFIPGTLGANNL
jgi:hypothetical protein